MAARALGWRGGGWAFCVFPFSLPPRNSPQPHTPREPHTALDRSPCGRRAQKKFLDLGGSAENQGDLRSVVLHKMTLGAQKSTFPIALGVRMTGVDDKAFSKTGESYSMITMPNADSHNSRVLQEDNTDLVNSLEFEHHSYHSTHAH